MSTKLIALLVFSTGFLQVSASESRQKRLKSEQLIADLMGNACAKSTTRAKFDLCITKQELAFNKSSLSLRLQRASRRSNKGVTKLQATEERDMKIREYSAIFKSCGFEDTRGPVQASENFRRLTDLYVSLPVQEQEQENYSFKQVAIWLPVPNPKQKGGTIKKTGNTVKRRLDFDEKNESSLL